MVVYFFDFHEINESPYLIKNPVANLLLFGHATQFASQKAINLFLFLLFIKTPIAGSLFTYLTTLRAASMCDFFGFSKNWLRF